MSGEPIVKAPIRTERLELHTVRPEEYLWLPGGERWHDNPGAGPQPSPQLQELWRERGFSNPYRHLIDDPGPLPYRQPRIQQDPSAAPYLLRWAVHREQRIIVGSAGFHDLPDGRGMIEIGLGIVPEHQRQGLARELLVGMWSWVVDQPGVRVLRYTVSPTNTASQRLIAGFGFAKVGEQMDEVDGLEEIYEGDARQWAKTQAGSGDGAATP